MSGQPIGAPIARPPEGPDGRQQATGSETCQLSTFNFQFSIPASWDALLDRPFEREPHRTTLARAEAAAETAVVYPPREDWFAAFRLTPPERVRVVILGQDPYHGPDQAMGLAFSVRKGLRLPPSLRNIFRELASDLQVPAPESGDLTSWAQQGVLLLNTVLTVEAGRANSHSALGWQAFTDRVLAALCCLPQPIAFVLWGAPAQRAFAQAAGNREQAAGSGTILNSQFPSSPPDPHRPPSQPPVRIPGLFRQQTLFADQRLSCRKRRTAHPLGGMSPANRDKSRQ